MNGETLGKDVTHHHEVRLAAATHVHAVKAVELDEQRVRVVHDVLSVGGQDLLEKGGLHRSDRLEHVARIVAKVEETPTLAGTDDLLQNVLTRQRDQVVGAVDAELLPNQTEHTRGVVSEGKVTTGMGGRLWSSFGWQRHIVALTKVVVGELALLQALRRDTRHTDANAEQHVEHELVARILLGDQFADLAVLFLFLLFLFAGVLFALLSKLGCLFLRLLLALLSLV
mmetsp:Transcript_465/g.1333  ORF Transcript_465/g.1333 Transcript_465/m.1333 type:complete len:227 (+) Transcript_465:1137-1817(+)